jgi:uncharacterized protein YqjF (DUF2071 family)
MANYAIHPALILPFVPKGTTLDFWEDECYVSLIGFMFDHSKLNGISIPFHQSFEEVNLRFYVKREERGTLKRGVVFIREYVPKAAVTAVANTIFHEHYETVPMRHQWTQRPDEQHIQYAWKKNIWHSIEIFSSINKQPLVPGSPEEFFTEHYWGYTPYHGHTLEYAVDHPPWDMYATKSFAVKVDFEMNYGKPFEFLNQQPPASVFLAEGSTISLKKTQKW